MTWLDIDGRCERRVQIYLSPDCRGSEGRVELSSGTRAAAPEDGSYDADSRLPREPWRPPTQEEAARLLSPTPPRDIGRSVYIVRLPDPFGGARGDSVRSDDEAALERQVLGALDRICAISGPPTCIGLTRNPPNLKTTTIDRSIDQHIGLHVDSWDDLDLDRRDRSANRVSVNLGAGDRYFLFLPVSVMEMARIMAQEIGARQVPRRDVTLLGQLFMQRFPEVPVARCRIAPGAAYIAPTENLVHDGSSEGQRHADEHFTVLGHIRLR
jgi:hypothetical protein